MEKNADPVDDAVLNEICVCIGPFKIPKTVGDLGILLSQTDLPDHHAAHQGLLSSFEPYRRNVEQLRTRYAEYSQAQHECIIDGPMRYTASQVIAFLAREIEVLRMQREQEIAATVQKPKFRSRLAATLQPIGISF